MALKRILFEYEALDKNKNKIIAEITAPSLSRARTLLATQGIQIIKIKQKKKTKPFFSRTNPVTNADITIFTRQMATMINAGIPMVQTLNVIAEGAPDTSLAELVRAIRSTVESGVSFSQALKRYPRYFDELYCNLIESGEQSGTLDIMLTRIAVYKEKSASIRRKVKKALYYPTAVLVVAILVTVLLLVKIVPTFKELFKSFNSELPLFTQFVLNISTLLQNYGMYVLISLIAIAYYVYSRYKKNSNFRHTVERLYLKIPIIGNILKKAIVARFARTLATTSSAGVPLTDAMHAVAKAADNIIYQQAIYLIRDNVAAGQAIHHAMRKTGVFPVWVNQMISIGEESGTLVQMLEKVANIYEEEVDLAVDGLTTLLEPIIMVILGIVVGGLVIAMYLPIFNMGSIV